VSHPVISVATECSLHELSIFPGMFVLGTALHLCDSGLGPHLVAISHCSMLRVRVINAIGLVDVTFLNKLWDDLEHHVDICLHNQGQPY
jgi:hypothetical protein